MNTVHSDYNAMYAARQMNRHNADAARALERISGGYRINSAADDPAGLGVSERMRAGITGLKTAAENARAGQNMINVAEGALAEVHTMLNRLADIAGRAVNGTLDKNARQSLQGEANQIITEIGRVAGAARWGDQPLLNGSPALDGFLQVGTGDVEHERIPVNLPNLSSILAGLGGFSVLTAEDAAASLDLVNGAIESTSEARVGLGALHNRLTHTVNSLETTAENLTEAESRIRDADVAKEMTRFVRSTTLAEAARLMFTHSLANRYRILDLLRTM